jgi:hypothetical protein
VGLKKGRMIKYNIIRNKTKKKKKTPESQRKELLRRHEIL